MSSGTGTGTVIISGGNFADSRVTGNGDECYLFGTSGTTGHLFSTTTAYSAIVDVRHCDRVGLQLITTDASGNLTGAWKIEVSGDYTRVSTGTQYGQVQGNSGNWTDITAAFVPAIAAVTVASSQFVQADIRTRAIRVTFTPTP